MAVKTAVGGADPQAYAYVAGVLDRAAKNLPVFNASIHKFVASVERARSSLHSILEAYYQSVEDEGRWEDDGGALHE